MQAQENVAHSPAASNNGAYSTIFRVGRLRQTVRFDLIISNPPYYEPGVECATPQWEQACYTPLRWIHSDVSRLLRRIVYRRWPFA